MEACVYTTELYYRIIIFSSAFIDIQKVIDDVDLNVLEENLANISLCDIEEEMVRFGENEIPIFEELKFSTAFNDAVVIFNCFYFLSSCHF